MKLFSRYVISVIGLAVARRHDGLSSVWFARPTASMSICGEGSAISSSLPGDELV